MREIVTIALVLCLLLTTATFAKTIDSEDNGHSKIDTIAKWTVMYYMCCDSNMYDLGEPLLENISKIGSKNDFNLVSLYDGIYDGDSEIIYFNENGERIRLNEIIGWPNEVDTSNPFTFEKFISDMMQHYPAEHYALIFYTSGGPGWQIFSVPDHHGTYGKLIKKVTYGFSIPWIGAAFENVTKDGKEKIDVIYTSCAMNTIEFAYEVAPYIDYIVGTQDCLSRDFVYRYYESVWELYNNTDMTPDEFVKYSADILKPVSFYYQDEWGNGIRKINKIFNNLFFKSLQTVKHHDNIGVINNSEINELIQSIDSLSRFLIVNIKDEDIYKNIGYARENSRESSKCHAKTGSKIMSILFRLTAMNFTAYNGVIDLYDFCEKLREKTDNIFLKSYCKDVMSNINKTIPYINKVENDPIHGLNIYFPTEKQSYNAYVLSGELPAKYEELAFSKYTTWDVFLKIYLGI